MAQGGKEAQTLIPNVQKCSLGLNLLEEWVEASTNKWQRQQRRMWWEHKVYITVQFNSFYCTIRVSWNQSEPSRKFILLYSQLTEAMNQPLFSVGHGLKAELRYAAREQKERAKREAWGGYWETSKGEERGGRQRERERASRRLAPWPNGRSCTRRSLFSRCLAVLWA